MSPVSYEGCKGLSSGSWEIWTHAASARQTTDVYHKSRGQVFIPLYGRQRSGQKRSRMLEAKYRCQVCSWGPSIARLFFLLSLHLLPAPLPTLSFWLPPVFKLARHTPAQGSYLVSSPIQVLSFWNLRRRACSRWCSHKRCFLSTPET